MCFRVKIFASETYISYPSEPRRCSRPVRTFFTSSRPRPARRAPGGTWPRTRPRRESWRTQQEAGATRPRGTRRSRRRPLALPRKRTAAAAEARPPGQLAAPAGCRNPPCVRETGPSSWRSHSRSRERSQSRPGCARRPTGTGQDDQTRVHAKPTLTVLFHRFKEAPVGRMARTGLGPPGTQRSCSNASDKLNLPGRYHTGSAYNELPGGGQSSSMSKMIANQLQDQLETLELVYGKVAASLTRQIETTRKMRA